MRIHAGIDIGKSALTVAVSDPAAPPHAWPVTSIDLEDPEWWRKLREIVPPGCTVVAEPTGTHYLTPIMTALTGLNCQLWLVNTTTTGKIRAVHVSSAKSDRTDAQALALAATWLAAGRPVHGARPHGYDPTARLRQLVNAHESAARALNRASNRFEQLAHAMWPALAQHKTTYLRAVSAGAVTPDEVLSLAARPDLAELPQYRSATARTHLFDLAEKIPPGIPAPDLKAQIIALHETMTRLTAETNALKAQIVAEIEKPPLAEVTRRWRTVPEASDLAIAALHVATRGMAETFTRDEFRAAVGAHPKRRQSGERTISQQTKAGYRPAMKHLHLWMTRLLIGKNRPNPVAAYFDQAKTKRRQAAARGKLAKLLHAVARNPAGYSKIGEAHTEFKPEKNRE